MDGSLITEIVCIVISLMLSAYFSATETALTSLNELKVRLIMKEYGERAKGLELWVSNPNKVLNTILFGNNLVNILASVLATNLALKLFGNASIAAITGIMTFVILIFGEITPKTFAKNNAATFAMFSMRVLRFFYILLFPITWVMNELVMLLLKFTGNSGSGKPKITEDELEFLINEGEKEGVLEKDKGEMLTNIFDISDIQVKEVMVPRTDVIAVDENINKVALLSLIEETEFSRIPVYRDSLDNIVGILYVKDIIRMTCRGYEVAEVMKLLRDPLIVPESKKIDMMLKDFQEKRLHMAVVVDEYGGTAGIVTLEDILEEIVGDILDEYDNEEKEVSQIGENAYIVDAGMDFEDFCEMFGMEMTEELQDCETIGGLILDIAGEVPNVGDKYSWRDFRFTVKDRKDNRIIKVLTEIHKQDDKPAEKGERDE